MTSTDNIRVGAMETNWRKYQILLGAVLLIVGLAMVLALATTMGSADPLPPDITSDQTISGDQYFNDSATNLSANIIVASGGNLTMDHVTIYVVGSSALTINGGGRVVIKDSTIMSYGGDYTIALNLDGSMVLTGNDISGYSDIMLYDANATIDGNQMTPAYSFANGISTDFTFNTYNYDGPSITNNTFGDCNGIQINANFASMRTVKISGNTFGWIYNDGLDFYIDYAAIDELDASMNTFTYTSGNGIYLSLPYGSYTTINVEKNVFQDTNNYGIYIYAEWTTYSISNWTFSGNDITTYWSSGIYFDGYYSTLYNIFMNDNKISTQSDGINFNNPYGGTNKVEMLNNQISTSYTPIYFYAYNSQTGSLTFKNNTVQTSYPWYNLYYLEISYSSIGDFVFSDNNIEHVSTNVIYMDAYGTTWSDITLTNNNLNDTGTFWDFGWSWDYTNVGAFVMSNNNFTNIHGNVLNGYCYYYTFDSITIENNYMDYIDSNGIYIEDYYGGITNDININHNTIKNEQYGSMIQIYIPHYGGDGLRGWFNFTDNKLDTSPNWGNGLYVYAYNEQMKGVNIERNVVKDIVGWQVFYMEFSSSTFTSGMNINNNTVARSQNGIWIYAYSINTPYLFVQNNTVINNQQDGIYLDLGNVNSPVFVENNLIIENSNYGLEMYSYNGNFADSRVDNNTFLKNGYGMYIDEMTKLTIADNKITSNNQAGLTIYGNWNGQDEYYLYNNNITNNAQDIVVYQGAILKSHNDNFETTSLQDFGGNQKPEIWVLGSMDIEVLWLDGTGPVANAGLQVYDTSGRTVLDDQVDANGWYKNIDMTLYTITIDGTKMNIPVTINATKYGILASVKVSPTYQSIVKVYLDNVPPDVILYSPQNKMVTNKMQVRVSGITEPDASLSINNVPIDLTKTGTFEYYMPLSREGNNDIKVIAKDKFNNTRIILLHVYRDTVSPSLVIDQPDNGMITNQPTVVVSGQTEPGAALKINDNLVHLDANGRFEFTVMLTEGVNNITIVATDAAGNEVPLWRNVNLDSVPPTLNIITPPNGLITNAAEIDIRGIADGASSVKLNSIGIKLLGQTFVTTLKLNPGLNTLLFEAWDDAGNHASLQITVIQDANPPQLDIVYPKDNLFTGNSVLVISGSSDIGNTVTVNGAPVVLDPNNGQFSYIVLLKEGTNRIVIRAVDKIGNTYEVVRNVFLDTTPPTLTVTNPLEKTMTNKPQLSVEGITDLNAAVSVNGVVVPTSGGSFKTVLTLKEGVNQIVILSTDLAGNRAMVVRDVTLVTNVDIQIFSPADNMRTTDDNVTFFGKVGPGATLKINGLDIQLDNTSKFSHNFPLSLGINDFQIVVTDQNGNVNTIDRTVVREQVPATPAKKTTEGLSGSTAWLAAALVGAIVGALMAIILFLGFSRRYGRGKEPVDEVATKEVVNEAAKEPEAKAPQTKPAPSQSRPSGKKGGQIHMVPPPASMVKKEEPNGNGAFSPTEDDTPTVKGMSDKAAGGEIEATGGELTELQKKVESLDAKGADTTKIKQSLKMAEIYASKNATEKAEKHIQKAKQMLNEMGTSGEIAPRGGEVEMNGTADKSLTPPPAQTSSSIPTIPPFPDLEKTDGNPPRKAKSPDVTNGPKGGDK
jgi:hypothetical protein